MSASRIHSIIAMIVVANLGVATDALGQPFPSRPITVIAPIPVGSSSEAALRRISTRLTATLGQPVVVENRVGANGVVGFVTAKQAKPDGHTLILANVGNLAINPWLYDKLPYDPVKDFQPLSLLWSFPSILFVPGTSEVKSVAELLAQQRTKPGTFGSQGIASGGHLLGELFNTRFGTRAVHVPYKGSAPVLADTIAGRVDFVFDGISADKAQMVRSGRLRAIAVADVRRSNMLPGVPTSGEEGMQGFELPVWFGMVAPAGLPAAVASRLQGELVNALHSAEVAPSLEGFDIIGSTPEEFAARISVDLSRYGPIVKNSGARAE